MKQYKRHFYAQGGRAYEIHKTNNNSLFSYFVFIQTPFAQIMSELDAPIEYMTHQTFPTPQTQDMIVVKEIENIDRLQIFKINRKGLENIPELYRAQYIAEQLEIHQPDAELQRSTLASVTDTKFVRSHKLMSELDETSSVDSYYYYWYGWNGWNSSHWRYRGWWGYSGYWFYPRYSYSGYGYRAYCYW